MMDLLEVAYDGEPPLIQPSNRVSNVNISQDVDISRFSDKNLLAFAAFITVTIMVIGILGNLLTIIALLRCPRVRNVAAAFIISLCVADFLFCVLILPFRAVTFIYGTWIFSDTLCIIIPLIRYGNVGVSLLSIAMITINRYIMIAHYGMYTRIYKPVWIACMIVFSWLLSFGMQVPTLLGIWGQFDYDSRLATCTIVKDVNGNSSKPALFTIGFAIPCLIIIICYAGIFWVVHSSETRMRQHAAKNTKDINNKNKEKKEAKNRRNEWRITKMVLAIFLSYIVCYLPITIVKVVDKDIQLPNLQLISYILLFLSACINPIIYVIMNKQYRQAYKTVLTCSPPRMLSTVPGPGSSFGGSNGMILNDVKPTGRNTLPLTQNISIEQRFRDKSKDEVSKTMVSQVSIALTPIKSSELPRIYDDHL